MKYSSNHYFVEKYEKCCVCGKLLYDEERKEAKNPDGKDCLYCSDWCMDWEKEHFEDYKKMGCA